MLVYSLFVCSNARRLCTAADIAYLEVPELDEGFLIGSLLGTKGEASSVLLLFEFAVGFVVNLDPGFVGRMHPVECLFSSGQHHEHDRVPVLHIHRRVLQLQQVLVLWFIGVVLTTIRLYSQITSLESTLSLQNPRRNTYEFQCLHRSRYEGQSAWAFYRCWDSRKCGRTKRSFARLRSQEVSRQSELCTTLTWVRQPMREEHHFCFPSTC